MKYILASKSPRRQQLLKNIIENFDVMVSEEPEIFEDGLSIQDQSMKVGYNKAKNVFDKTLGDRLVIESDTIVVKDNKLYGKPQNREQAIMFLHELNNSKHQVITSIVVLIEKDGEKKVLKDCVTSEVYFDNISDLEINDWVDSGKAFDNAGAYAIQDEFSKFIKKIDGDYYSIMGLPINKLYSMIKDYID